MGKYYTRMKDLDHYDHQFGLMIDYAVKNEQTGQIEYHVDNDILANYQQIDRRKGRFLITWLDDLPVYGELENQEETRQKLDQIWYCEQRICQLKEEIIEKNKELGWDEEKGGYY